MNQSETAERMRRAMGLRDRWVQVGANAANRVKRKTVETANRKAKEWDSVFRSARSALVESVYPLIIDRVSVHCGRHRDREDIVGAACVRVMTSIDQYDPKRGALTTFVSQLVFAAVTDYYRHNNLIHIPENVQVMIKKGEEGDTDRQRSNVVMATMATTIAENDNANGEGVGGVESVYVDHDELSGIEQQETMKALLDGVSSLDSRRSSIIRRRFGLGCEPESLEEIGGTMGITKERVRQIESSALTMLRSKLSRSFQLS